MYSITGEYPDSPAESEESITDESPDVEGTSSQVSSPGYGGGRGCKGFPSRRESTAEKQRKWAVRTFTLWLTGVGVSKAIEDMNAHELNQLLKKFYKEARRKDGCDFSKPGLTNIRNALDRYVKSKLNFTILKSSEFEEANKAFDEKIAMIEGNAASPWRHSVSISPPDMQKILASGAIGGNSPLLLLRACWFNILLHFDVGDHLKQRRLSKQQFVIHRDSAGLEHVKMMSCYPYVSNAASLPTTMHSVPGHPLCPVSLLKKYLSKLHPESDTLFQCPVQYNVDDSVPVWYEKQAVGVHALEGMMSCLSKEAGLSRIYSNGCLRKSSSLVYLQCGFGFNPQNITNDASVSGTGSTPVPSSPGMTSLTQNMAPDSRPPLQNIPSSSTSPQSDHRYSVAGEGNSASYFPFSSENKPQDSSYSSQTGLHHPMKFENNTNPICTGATYPQIASTVSFAKHDTCQNTKRLNPQSLLHTESPSQSRTAIGVCMPTIKIEEGSTTICDGSTTMGVQPTFPSESIDFPSVTEAMSVRRDVRSSVGSDIRETITSSQPTDIHSKTYLHMAVLGGKSFIDFEHYQSSQQEQIPSLVLHVHFRDHRFKSKDIPCTSHPSLKEDFYLELHHNTSVDSNVLLNITDPINLILSKTETNGNVTLIGSHSFYWQKVLKEPDGILAVTVDVNGMAEESKMMVGALELRFEILSNGIQVVQPNVLDSHLSNMNSRVSERERRFMGYARQWWKEYMAGHPSHSRQQVKIFAQNECSSSKPVVSFIRPIETGHLLEGPRHAAKFVSLFKHEEECSMFGSKVDSWSSIYAFLCRGKGSCEDHAILLTSILIGFGLEAYVCLGTKDTGQPHAWVMTKQLDGHIVFWESLTGQRYDLSEDPSTACPQYRTLGCVFSNTAFFANIQASGLISQCDFDITNSTKWKAMDSGAIYAICGSEIQPALPVPPCLSPPTIDSLKVSKKLEQELKAAIEDYRKGLSLTIQWDNKLAHILSPCLAAYEQEARTGFLQNLEELREPVYRQLTRQTSFQSITRCINHVKVIQAITEIQALPEFQTLIDFNQDNVEFALRVQVFPYPENVCSVWIILGAKYPVIDEEPTYQWQHVSLQSQI